MARDWHNPCVRFTLIGLGAIALLTFVGGQAGSQKSLQQAPPAPKDGTRVQWQAWAFNWSLRPVEGLVLTDVYFHGRKVLTRSE
jgi:Cu2+-containing amine oxidase